MILRPLSGTWPRGWRAFGPKKRSNLSEDTSSAPPRVHLSLLLSRPFFSLSAWARQRRRPSAMGQTVSIGCRRRARSGRYGASPFADLCVYPDDRDAGLHGLEPPDGS